MVEWKTTKTAKIIPSGCFYIYNISLLYTIADVATNIADKPIKASILVDVNIGAPVLFNLVNYIYTCYALKQGLHLLLDYLKQDKINIRC